MDRNPVHGTLLIHYKIRLYFLFRITNVKILGQS